MKVKREGIPVSTYTSRSNVPCFYISYGKYTSRRTEFRKVNNLFLTCLLGRFGLSGVCMKIRELGELMDGMVAKNWDQTVLLHRYMFIAVG